MEGITFFYRFSIVRKVNFQMFKYHPPRVRCRIFFFKLPHAGNNKILDCMNRLKSRFFENIDFFIFLYKLPITIFFTNLAKNSKNRPKILVPVKNLDYNTHTIVRYSKN
jgi:hypothetical protein